MRLLILVGLLSVVASHAQALTFQTRLEKVVWQVEGDQFECRLMQPIAGFGLGGFVRKAGEAARFQLMAQNAWFERGSAKLLSAAAPWRQGLHRDISLGSVAVGSQSSESKVFSSSFEQAGRLLTGLLEGRSPLVQHRSVYGKDPVEVRLLPVRFDKAYEDYQACTAKLLPVNFEQIQQNQLGFSGSEYMMDAHARAQIDLILMYMKADPTVNRIYLDGHSDNTADRLTNREFSRQRALAVQDYLLRRGVKPEQIVLRFHGERYPLAPNNSKANRAKNRRVTLSLERVAPPDPAEENPSATPPAAVAPVAQQKSS